MNLLCRWTWGLACLASFAAIALVGCGQATSRTAAPEPVRIASVTLESGETDEISLSNKFSGEKLTYTAESSNTAVATAKVDGVTLTVTAVGAGTATITVTATDPEERSAKTSFTVTVSQPEEEEEEGAPTVRSGATDSVDVDQGDTETVTLSRVFTGADLEFTVSSSDPGVATASESAGILTITARSPGSATITIVATNDAGTVTHQIAVTVPEPVTTPLEPETPTTNNPSSCPSPLTIHRLVNDTKKCTLPMGHTMSSTVEDTELEVRESTDSADTDNVWLIIGKKKGTYTVTIFDTGVSAGAITVIVPNIPPKRKSDVVNPSGVMPETTLSMAKPDGGTADLNLANYFTDDDGDTWRYRVKEGGKPDWVLINTEDGFIYGTDFVRDFDTSTTDSKLTLEVLKKVEDGKQFTISLYAVDDSGGESERPVTLKFGPASGSALPPRVVSTYKATQLDNGDLRARNDDLVETALKVGPRRGVEHTLTFEDLKITGFAFANSAYADLEGKDFVPVRGTPSLYCKRGNDYLIHDCTGTNQVLPPDTGDDYFVLESSGSVEAIWDNSDLGSNPAVKFTLKEGGNSGTIIIRYFVVPAKTADVNVSNASEAGSARPYDRRLRVNVVTCSSPPDPIDDCP